jgi:orotidine-5'-phosphate decarboxylase
MQNNLRKVICALDTGDIDEALKITKKLAPHVGAFKIGHALTLPHGLDVIDRLREAGADRIFLDLKFHDIPNSVALAVREAAKRGVWMMTLHISGGPAMLSASVEQARAYAEEAAPLLVGVSVLTSIDEHMLNDDLGVNRKLEDHMVLLSKLAVDVGLDGVVCSAEEIKAIRKAIGHQGVIVTPGIRVASGETHDQKRVGEASQALADGADYLVIGRALTDSPDPEKTLESLGFQPVG